jgi:hypothetical protein
MRGTIVTNGVLTSGSVFFNIRTNRTIDECFLVAPQQVKLVINSAAKRAVLAFLHLNADLWTSKVSHQKFLGVRVFWKSGPELKTALLAVTLYAPPKGQDKAASEWLLEYVLAVLKWYGVEPSHVNGATSDAGSDCKKVFHKLARKHGWMWLWCFPHTMHCVLVFPSGNFTRLKGTPIALSPSSIHIKICLLWSMVSSIYSKLAMRTFDVYVNILKYMYSTRFNGDTTGSEASTDAQLTPCVDTTLTHPINTLPQPDKHKRRKKESPKERDK